jgi:predicted Zn finger-like uncharacterized protein
MQFVCNNCKAKYEIPPDRITGRILKIRCRECGNVIEIRGDAILAKGGDKPKAAPGPSGKAGVLPSSLLKDKFKASFTKAKPLKISSAAAAPRPAAEPATKADKLLKMAQKAEARAMEMKESDKWYVAIKSSPVGPVNKAKVRAYIRKADLTLSSLVWREGFNDWKPLKTVPELSQIFDEVRAEIQRPEAIDIAARLKRAAAQPSPASKPPPAPRPARSRVAVAAAAAPQAVELEPIDSLASLPPPEAAGPAAPQAAASPIDDALRGYYVGRIDAQGSLPGMESMRPSYIAEYMPAGYPLAAEHESLPRRLMQSRLFLLVGGSAALLAGFAIMIIVMVAMEKKKDRGGENAVVKEKETPLVPPGVEEPVGDGDLLAGLIISVEEVMESEGETAEEDTPKVKGTLAMKSKKTTESVFKTTVADMPDVEEHSIASSELKKKVSQKESEGAVKGKNGLSDDQIKSTVIERSKTIQRCYEKVLGKGMGIDEQIKVKVQVTVGISGKVTKVRVISVTKYGNFLTPCIENGIKTWTFPKSDAPSEFIFPVLLTPKT